MRLQVTLSAVDLASVRFAISALGPTAGLVTRRFDGREPSMLVQAHKAAGQPPRPDSPGPTRNLITDEP